MLDEGADKGADMRQTDRRRQLLYKITSEEILEEAYCWACKTCKDTGPNNVIWDLRFNWQEIKPELIKELRNDSYHLFPLRRYITDGEGFDCWDVSRDTLVLKAIAIVLSEALAIDIPSCCTKAKDLWGCKKSIREVQSNLKDCKFVYKSDVKSYSASIGHDILLSQLKEKTSDKIVLRLVAEYWNRLVWIDGEYNLIVKGIALGYPLSTLFGAWFLRELDIALVQQNIFYRKFMDDWIVLANTRNHLRKTIKMAEQVLSRLKLKKHPYKTFIGWIKKGFDFLGYMFTTEGLQISVKCKERCRVKIIQLYERVANLFRIGLYWHNWGEMG
jgi:RNA-directed DNA polymerase